MKPTLPMVTLLLAVAGVAQDVEPTLDRALASLVSELVTELPYRAPGAQALAIDPDRDADRAVVDALAAKLLAEGFRIESGAPRDGESVRLAVSARTGGKTGSLRVTAGDWVAERRFGRASWVDRPADSGAIVVVGTPSDSAEDSLAAARDQLRAQLGARFPAIAGTRSFESYVSRQPTQSFVAERTIHGRKRYEAYLMAEPAFGRLARAEKVALRAERRAPWLKAGVLALGAGVLWVLYMRADFRSRGYRTRRLRFLFGSLFVGVSIAIWSLRL